MIDRGHDLALATQADLLGIARSTLYRQPRAVPAADLVVMRRIDELHLDHPFAGSRMMRAMLVNEGTVIGRTHVRTLMRRVGIEALYRRPRSSKPAPGHKIDPYLLRDMTINRPNQVWATDITYIPMARGVCLPRRGAGLVQPACVVVAGLDHAGGGLLHRGG
jgi:putative transposase